MKKHGKNTDERRIKTLTEQREWVAKQKKSYSRDATLRTMDLILADKNDVNEHSLIIRLERDRAARFLKFERDENRAFDMLRINKTKLIKSFLKFADERDLLPVKIHGSIIEIFINNKNQKNE